MANASDQVFLMKGYLGAGGQPMPFASLFFPARTEFASRVREVVRRVSAMAAAEKGARYTPLYRSPYEEAWKP